ncbi:hypothetical protein Q1695_012705 [Nippostrongylus brasiliensis]|nr:hypothetical protein Q1695_012705 [Nippostrongylus brasiliensis]
MESIQQIQPPPYGRTVLRVCVSSDDPQSQESPSDFDKDSGDEPIYEDRFCKVTSKDIFVKSYYFPCGSQARLPLEAITNMWFLSREEGPPTISWGSIDGKIWWALNEKRCRKAESQNNVVVHEPHHRPRLIGFSVRNKHRFLVAVHAFDGFPVEISSPPI